MAKSISVSELKEKLSRYIRRAQLGDEIQILSRGRPVARLVGMGGAAHGDQTRRERLVAAGILRRGTASADTVLREPLVRLTGSDLSGSLSEERGDRA